MDLITFVANLEIISVTLIINFSYKIIQSFLLWNKLYSL